MSCLVPPCFSSTETRAPQPLPYPPKPGSNTGFACPATTCAHLTPHELIYFNPSHQPNAPLIGIRCPLPPRQTNKNKQIPNNRASQGHFRIYQLDLYKSALAQLLKATTHNTRTKPAGAPAHQSNTWDVSNMNISDLLNQHQEATVSIPPRREPSRVKRPEVQPSCTGVGGKLAKGHSARKNVNCSVGACAACCTTLNHFVYCSKHLAQKKRKGLPTPDPNTRTSAIRNGTRRSPDSDVEIVPHPNPSDRTYTRRLAADENLTQFRPTTLLMQVQERTASEALSLAKKTVTFVAWLGNPGRESSFEILRAPCTTWPALALQEIKRFQTFVAGRVELQGELQVWSPEERGWVSMEISTVQQYSEDTRKILIKNPNVPHSECDQVELYIESLNEQSIKERMDLYNELVYTTPLPSPSKRQHSGTPQFETNSNEAGTPAMLASTSNPNPTRLFSPVEIEESSTSAKIIDLVTPSPPTAALSKEVSQRQWPGAAPMSDVFDFFQKSNSTSPKITIKEAWKATFGNSYAFVQSTVTFNHRWMKTRLYTALEDYCTRNPNATMAEARRYVPPATSPQ